METFVSLLTYLVKEFAKNLSTLDMLLVLIVLVSWYVCYTIASKLWSAFQEKLNKIQEEYDVKLARIEKHNQENMEQVTKAIEEQTRALRDVNETFQSLNIKVVEAVTILRERGKN